MPEKILIVEDDPKNRKVLAMALRRSGYTLLEAVDGQEGLETAVRDKPDLIIMDVQLPRMSGLEATRKLRQLPGFNHVPIIGVTAYAMKGDREKVIEAGCDAYMSKPIDVRELPRVVSEMLLQRQEVNPLPAPK